MGRRDRNDRGRGCIPIRRQLMSEMQVIEVDRRVEARLRRGVREWTSSRGDGISHAGFELGEEDSRRRETGRCCEIGKEVERAGRDVRTRKGMQEGDVRRRGTRTVRAISSETVPSQSPDAADGPRSCKGSCTRGYVGDRSTANGDGHSRTVVRAMRAMDSVNSLCMCERCVLQDSTGGDGILIVRLARNGQAMTSFAPGM